MIDEMPSDQGELFESLEVAARLNDDDHNLSIDEDSVIDQVADEIIDEAIEASVQQGDVDQLAFIDFDEWWKAEWQGMPEFVQDDLMPWKTLFVHFKTRQDMVAFAQLIGRRLTFDTAYIWFPPDAISQAYDRRYVDAS